MNIAINTDFYIGKLTHFNFPISSGTAASSVILNIIFTVKSSQNGALIANQTYSFNLNIDETPNAYPCTYIGTSPCPDRIDVQNQLISTNKFKLGNVDYTLIIIGFKEETSSTSSPVNYFISNEGGKSNAYLFARITAACPAICEGGGSVVIVNNQECRCDCRTRNPPCNAAQTTTASCGCVCPNPNQCLNGGTINPNTCTCNCPACTDPNKVLDPNFCGCTCRQDVCGAGSISNPNTCACDCSALSACPVANEVRNNRCSCVCNKTCTGQKIENPDPRICDCICSNTCQPNYVLNPNTCACTCNRVCPNGQVLNQTACTCEACAPTGNWVKDNVTGLCTVCPLTPASCNQFQRFDNASCKCVCTSLSCNLYNDGLVVDQTKECACRPCIPGECICGNGKIDVGETCDSAVPTPCCKNCTLNTGPCDDGDLCTSGDSCDGTLNFTCKGDYKCPQSSECVAVSCNSSVGVCVYTPVNNYLPCEENPNLCEQRCLDGVCNKIPVTCAADNNTNDCFEQKCIPSTGLCGPRVNVSLPCTDNDGCTVNDRCNASGICVGTPRFCEPSTNPCIAIACNYGFCEQTPLSGNPCNADSDLCTIGDICVLGVCSPGTPVICRVDENDVCHQSRCDSRTGTCVIENRPNYENITCNDRNVCTKNDLCVNGTCIGSVDQTLIGTEQCSPVSPSAVNNTIIIFSVAGAAALIGAIVGIAFLIKKIRDSKILAPDTWNPDTFSSVGANPLYKGNQKIVDNRLFEGSN
jgi:hypothetical protein